MLTARERDVRESKMKSWKTLVRQRYSAGEWRSPIFRDLVLESIREHGPRVLDIGCGHGFDDSQDLQREIAEQAQTFTGVEPDPEIEVPDYFDVTHHCVLEQASVSPGSIDVAYSMFVMEHVADATAFWNSVYDALAPGGVFWGFTVDGRHAFRLASDVLETLKLKDLYLRLLQGRRGQERYENYPTHYRCNTPRTIQQFTTGFESVECLSLHRPGQLDYYFPSIVRPLTRTMEWTSTKIGLPGSVLIVRAVKPGMSSAGE